MNEDIVVDGSVTITAYRGGQTSIISRVWFLVSVVPRYLLTGDIKVP